MRATIRRYDGNPDLAERLAARSDDVQALISGVAGFRAYYLVQSDDGTASITICDDQAGVEESSRLAASFLAEQMPDVVSAAPEMFMGEVVIDF